MAKWCLAPLCHRRSACPRGRGSGHWCRLGARHRGRHARPSLSSCVPGTEDDTGARRARRCCPGAMTSPR